MVNYSPLLLFTTNCFDELKRSYTNLTDDLRETSFNRRQQRCCAAHDRDQQKSDLPGDLDKHWHRSATFIFRARLLLCPPEKVGIRDSRNSNYAWIKSHDPRTYDCTFCPGLVRAHVRGPDKSTFERTTAPGLTSWEITQHLCNSLYHKDVRPFVRGLPHPCLWVQVRDGGVASCPGVFSSGIRPRRIKWQWLEPLFLASWRCRRHIARGRARSASARGRRVCAASRWRKGTGLMVGTQRGWEGDAAQAAHAADRRWSDAGGRRPDQGGASVTRWRRSNRARLPTADQAIHASDDSSQGSTRQPASFNLVLSSVAMSIRCLRRATRGRARHRACAAAGGGGHPG
ncbi:hypothetical protein EVAR_65266_1 [Eumeta japonica]|uniref:Uncharacterized protein n=1 Tax=Eumeta variegata TaxID=151549 RepID=A0A4C1ZD40_EUMVA|nr:hypothetical protein EVAR_65266_1 [Eumeta japonica]